MKKIALCLCILSVVDECVFAQAGSKENNKVEQQESKPRSRGGQFGDWIGGLFRTKEETQSSQNVKNTDGERVSSVEEAKELRNAEKDSSVEQIENTEETRDAEKMSEQTIESVQTQENTPKHSESGEKLPANEMADDIPTMLPLFRKTENAYNRIADKIAGLSADNSSEYRDYSDQITQNWNKLCERSLKRVRPWAIKNIDPYLKDIQCVFYVFGGPDISYACEFFPYANEYILVGLEPLGNFDGIKNLVDSGNLQAFRTAINTYLQKGYFITSEMGKQFSKNEGSRGGLGMVLLQLARLNYDIISVESMGINSNGAMVSDGADVLSAVKIVFKKDLSGDELSTAYYIRMDLSDSNMRRLKMLANFVKDKRFVTFVKSASYALQDRDFTTLRNFILYNTEAILQDDTGIAFSMLSRWDLHIFGRYSGATLKIFKNYVQEDMVRYFQDHPATPINFQLGYGFDQKRPALILALRKDNPRVPMSIEDCQERSGKKSNALKIIKRKLYEKRLLKKLKLG